MNKILKIIIVSILSLSYLSAITIKELNDMPKCIERDFYIWKFLKDANTTKKQAIKAYKMIFRVNSKLKKSFRIKTGLEPPKRAYASRKKDISRYKELMQKIESSTKLFEKWIKFSPKDKLLFFNLAGKKNRRLLNKKLETSSYNKLVKYYAINEFIERTFKENLSNFKKIILNTKPILANKITYDNLLKIGFENLKQNRAKKASYFFDNATYKTKDRFSKDRALFWLYMATKNSKYLKKVANSYDYNMYKLIALDFLNKPYPKPKIEPLNSDLNPIIDTTNPIEWAKLKQKIFSKNSNLHELAKLFNAPKTAAHYHYILCKASRYKNQYFPILYQEILSSYRVNRQALLLAIARQESHFIPASVSRSFAVGMMQFMPFLIKHIAKVRHEKIKLDDIFNPKVSLSYANTHLDYLNKYLYNPLFIAYAYNAGIGYTRRMIRKNLFKEGPYEPYLSLELVDNKQANHYGKKVLANFVIYRMLLGFPIKITKIINELTDPLLTDRFR